MKALECRVQSILTASAAACQSLGISLPISKPATQIADPCRNVCSLGKAGCTPLKCLLARGMHSTARTAHVEGFLPPHCWDQQHIEEGAKDGAIRAAGTCTCAVSVTDPMAHSTSGGPWTYWGPEQELER